MNLPFSQNMEILKQPIMVGGRSFENRLAIQPMEGCDGTADGSPSELTVNRYHRFAKSGAGLIWFEAVAVQNDGRANPRQLWLNEKNADSFKRLINDIKETALKETGVTPVIIAQATHSGRYSRPTAAPEPLIARNNPLFEGDNPIPPDRIITDDALQRIEQSYAEVAKLAAFAGLDGIDVKCCHGYLNSELLSSHTREGRYGGSLENRMRFFKNAVEAVRSNAPNGFTVTSRMNLYDGFPYPYGFGVSDDGSITPDLSEPLRVIEAMKFDMLNVSVGNPYVNPAVTRPTEIEGVERIFGLIKQVQDRFPSLCVIASAPTFLRERSGELAAGAVEQGYCKIVGFGRMAFAYPGFAKDILAGEPNTGKVCITCGKCSQLMRAGSVTGCVVRDRYYTDLYREVFKG